MYSPTGAPADIIHGYVSGGFAGITETYTYNNRLEVTGIEATSSGGTPLNLVYSYAQSSHNNGNVTTQTNNVTSGRTQTYTYDPLNRLLTAQASATSGNDCWGQGFGNNATPPTLGDDALANLLAISATKCSSPALSVSVNGYNQISSPTGYSYDNDGDMTADNSFTYTYDAEKRIRSADVGGTYYCYIYDGNGMRVEKATASSSACSSPTAYELYWRNIAGNTIAETDGSGSTTNSSYNEYVFFAGRRIAQSTPNTTPSQVYYYFVDHLGSTRAVTDASGNACWEADYYPYGQEKTPASFSSACSLNPTVHYKFTGYERDPETDPGNGTGNDYAFARHYSPRLGRFMSADPLDGDVSDPQTLNKYAYTRNNPVNLTDPSGMCGGPAGNVSVSMGGYSSSGNVYSDPCPILDLGDPGFYRYIYLSGCDISGPCTFGSVTWTVRPLPEPAQRKVKSTTPPPQNTGRVTQVARCSASLANTMSVAHYAHLQNIPVASNIFSNDFSTVTNLIFGPNRAGAAGGLAENLGSGPALGLTAKGAGAVPVGSGLQFLFSSVPATTVGGTAIGGILTKALGVAADVLSGEAEAQAIYDAGVYAGAAYVCSQQ